jgi:hypothetical protein
LSRSMSLAKRSNAAMPSTRDTCNPPVVLAESRRAFSITADTAAILTPVPSDAKARARINSLMQSPGAHRAEPEPRIRGR